MVLYTSSFEIQYWLARFSNDDHVALRFLKQDEIEAFAPIEISVVSSNSPSKTHTFISDSSSSATLKTSPSSSDCNPAILQTHRVEQSTHSSQSTGSNSQTPDYKPEDRSTCSPLSSRSMSNSTMTSSTDSTTPPSQVGSSSIGDNGLSGPSDGKGESPFSLHRIHVLFQRLKAEDVSLFHYRVKYRSGSSTLNVIDWSEIEGIAPSEESKLEDRVRVLHVSATDLGDRGIYYS